MSPSKNLLFLMSGSIAAFKACQVVSQLVQDGFQVQVVMTEAATHFVGPVTLEGLTGRKVLTDIWQEGHAMDHIALTRWADRALLCPASANTIAKLAHGMADDLLSAMALAWPAEKPFLIAPAMNHQMLDAEVTKDNLARLRRRGFQVLPTDAGNLACGEVGLGRMLEPEQIMSYLKIPTRGHILVTGGATREPIDGIRFLSNVSTGQTAAALCDQLATMGWQVTYLHGVAALQPHGAREAIGFTTCQDLDGKLRSLLGSRDYAAVIHAAAVSDYSVQQAQPDVKLESQSELTLHLKLNPKLLPNLKEYSRLKTIQVIGFKLTLNSTVEDGLVKGQNVLSAGVDAIVTNDWLRVASDRTRHPGTLLERGTQTEFNDLTQLSQLLNAMITKGINHDLNS